MTRVHETGSNGKDDDLSALLHSSAYVLPGGAHWDAGTVHAGSQRDEADRVHGRSDGVGRVPQPAACRGPVPDQWHYLPAHPRPITGMHYQISWPMHITPSG